MLTCLVLLAIITVVTLNIYVKLTCGICKSNKHLVGNVVIVTGANTGIGFETAKDLADRGAKVILGCRSDAKGIAARDKIVSETGNTDVHYRNLDLASLASVRRFAEDILTNETKLDILVNNAGLLEANNVTTDDGLLLGMQTNYFGPFLLTNLLLPLLKSSVSSRIVNVTSLLHHLGRIDFDNLNMEKTFSKTGVYFNSKLCIVLMTVELARQLKGSGVTANSCHPGSVNTEILSNIEIFWYSILRPLQRFYSKNAWEGAQTQIYLAVSPEVNEVSGAYFSDCGLRNTSKVARDTELAKKLWDVSERLVKLK